MTDIWTVEQREMLLKLTDKTAKLRKRVGSYRKDDQGYALFRLRFINKLGDALVAKIEGKPTPKEVKKYVRYWEGDLGIGKDIVEVFKIIEDFEC